MWMPRCFRMPAHGTAGRIRGASIPISQENLITRQLGGIVPVTVPLLALLIRG
jgi:hypothetical protein